MSYKMFRVLAAVLAIALVYIGYISRMRAHDHYYYQMFLLFGFQVLVALGLGTVRDNDGWRLRFLPITLCLLVNGAFFLWDTWPPSQEQLMGQMAVVPPIWLMLSAIFDLSGQPATNPLLRGYRRTANLLRSPVLLSIGSALVIFGMAFGKHGHNEWVTAISWISWDAEVPYAIRNYLGLAVSFALFAAAVLTLLTLAVLIGSRDRLPRRVLQFLAFVVFIISGYAMADAGFAAYGLLLGDTLGLRELYITWALLEVVALGFVIFDYSRFGYVRRQTRMGLLLLIAPQVQLALQLCVGFLQEDGWLHSMNYTTFYLGVGLLLWAFARMVCKAPATEPLDGFEDARPKSLAVTV